LSYFEANLALLASGQPGLAHLLRSVSLENIKVTPSACGLPTASYDRNGSPLMLHSRYEPLLDARNALKKVDLSGADYFILLGFGLGYVLDALLEAKKEESNHYFVVESDLRIIRAALEARDLSSVLSRIHVHFAWPASGPELAEQWRLFFDPVRARKSAYIYHLPSLALNPGLFKSAAEIIQSQTFQIFTDINTLIGKSQEFLDNFVQNIRIAARAPGVISFSGKFRGVPAVIVSAGPSLDKNIHELRRSEDRLLILSTDTASKPLISAGINPHFILTGDPSYVNYLHLKGTLSKEAYLVAETTSFPQAFRDFEGRSITCIFENSSLRSLSDLLGNKGTLRAWGSVSTMALDFALLLKCDPIIFVGQDLAHTDGRIYCSGVYFDEEWFAGINDPEGWKRRMEEIRASRRTVAAEDIFERPIESTDKLMAYWNWMIKVMRDHPEVHFINATEGGILREFVTISSLKEALSRHCGVSRDLRKRIGDAYAAAQQSNLIYPGVNLSVLTGELAAIEDTLKVGLGLCKPNGNGSPQGVIRRLKALKESIYYNVHIAPLMDCFNQIGNYRFLRRKIELENLSSADLLPVLQDIYSEYFISIREALTKISKALHQITRELAA
jgi:hypothetical protein